MWNVDGQERNAPKALDYAILGTTVLYIVARIFAHRTRFESFLFITGLFLFGVRLLVLASFKMRDDISEGLLYGGAGITLVVLAVYFTLVPGVD